MKKVAFLFLFMLCLCSCRMHDDYTGEPFFKLMYTVDGKQASYEDWGQVEKYYFGSGFTSESYGSGLWLKENANGGEARFDLDIERLSLRLETRTPYFIEGERYDVASSGESRFAGNSGSALITAGWYCFSRKSSQPYCPYDLLFEFTCTDGQGLVTELKDGCIQVGRRFQRDIKGLIKESEE